MTRSELFISVAVTLGLLLTTTSATLPAYAPEDAIRVATAKIAAFDSSLDLADLRAASNSLASWAVPARDGNENVLRRRDFVRAWATLLAAVDRHIDTSFDPHDPKQLPTLSVQPPREKDGRQLPAGSDPNEVRDPIARAQYEVALGENERKIERVNFQAGLRNVDDEADNALRVALRNFHSLTPPDSTVIGRILATSGVSERRRARILSLL